MLPFCCFFLRSSMRTRRCISASSDAKPAASRVSGIHRGICFRSRFGCAGASVDSGSVSVWVEGTGTGCVTTGASDCSVGAVVGAGKSSSEAGVASSTYQPQVR